MPAAILLTHTMSRSEPIGTRILGFTGTLPLESPAVRLLEGEAHVLQLPQRSPPDGGHACTHFWLDLDHVSLAQAPAHQLLHKGRGEVYSQGAAVPQGQTCTALLLAPAANSTMDCSAARPWQRCVVMSHC